MPHHWLLQKRCFPERKKECLRHNVSAMKANPRRRRGICWQIVSFCLLSSYHFHYQIVFYLRVHFLVFCRFPLLIFFSFGKIEDNRVCGNISHSQLTHKNAPNPICSTYLANSKPFHSNWCRQKRETIKHAKQQLF